MRGAPSLSAPLVVGAGPAGCAAAIVLARAGAAPILIDRDDEARDALCGGFVSWRTAERLRALGVDLAALGARRIDALALFRGRHSIVQPLPEPCFALSRHALDGALRREAERAGARIEIDALRAIEGDAAFGKRRAWRGAGLFLATGKHDLRGAGRPRHTRDPALGLRWRLPRTAERDALLAGRIELHLFAGGYAGIVRQEDGTANLCLALRKSRLADSGGDPATLLDALAAENPALACRLGGDWRDTPADTVGAIPYGWIARDTAPGLFRLGDQAAVIPSLAGEGIGLALASGAMAARAWIEAGGAAAARDYQRAFAGVVAGPLRAAGVARWFAETPVAAGIGLALARRAPRLVEWLAEASRLAPEAPLAQPVAAP